MTPTRHPAIAGLALALTPMLGGCIAAVALPLVAGGALSARSHAIHVRAATRADAAAAAATVPASVTAITGANPQVTLTGLTELPPPSGTAAPAESDRWRPFFDYARTAGKETDHLESALLASPPDLASVHRRPCATKHPAVVIDLDQGREAFAPEHVAPAPLPVVEGLAQLREAGLTVLWITRLPGGRANDVAAALKTAGLDPQGADQLLLLRSAGDRKQVLREEAQADVCIVAIAGDDRGDFDELFDYLRNPAGAPGLYPIMGSGWFLIPSPFGGAPAASSDAAPAP